MRLSMQLTKDAIKYAATTEADSRLSRHRQSWQQPQRAEDMREEKLQRKLHNNRWEDEELNTGCFDLMSRWKRAPSHTIAEVHRLYQQHLPQSYTTTRKQERTPYQMSSADYVEKLRRVDLTS